MSTLKCCGSETNTVQGAVNGLCMAHEEEALIKDIAAGPDAPMCTQWRSKRCKYSPVLQVQYLNTGTGTGTAGSQQTFNIEKMADALTGCAVVMECPMICSENGGGVGTHDAYYVNGVVANAITSFQLRAGSAQIIKEVSGLDMRALENAIVDEDHRNGENANFCNVSAPLLPGSTQNVFNLARWAHKLPQQSTNTSSVPKQCFTYDLNMFSCFSHFESALMLNMYQKAAVTAKLQTKDVSTLAYSTVDANKSTSSARVEAVHTRFGSHANSTVPLANSDVQFYLLLTYAVCTAEERAALSKSTHIQKIYRPSQGTQDQQSITVTRNSNGALVNQKFNNLDLKHPCTLLTCHVVIDPLQPSFDASCGLQDLFNYKVFNFGVGNNDRTVDAAADPPLESYSPLHGIDLKGQGTLICDNYTIEESDLISKRYGIKPAKDGSLVYRFAPPNKSRQDHTGSYPFTQVESQSITAYFNAALPANSQFFYLTEEIVLLVNSGGCPTLAWTS